MKKLVISTWNDMMSKCDANCFAFGEDAATDIGINSRRPFVISGQLVPKRNFPPRSIAFDCAFARHCNLLLANHPPALAQDFYKDKTIRFIVGQAAGGGYDTYTRTIARYIGKHIPGNPTTMVDNMTGAGSLVAANYLYNNAKPDGLTIGNWNSALVFNQAMGDRQRQVRRAQVRLDRRAEQKRAGLLDHGISPGQRRWTRSSNPAKPLRMGGTGPGSHSIDMPLMLNKMLGTKFTVVSGYQGTAQIKIALQRREVDGHCTNWDSVLATQKDLLDGKGDERMIPFSSMHASMTRTKPKASPWSAKRSRTKLTCAPIASTWRRWNTRGRSPSRPGHPERSPGNSPRALLRRPWRTPISSPKPPS